MNRARQSVPSAVTFASLACGMMAMMLAMEGELQSAGALILLSYVLDALDGILARKLGAASALGIQLDSIVDMVALGVAPAILVTQHLRSTALDGWPVRIPVLLYVMAGAFRLARFNLGACKGKTPDTCGLTISTGGAFVTLAVLAELSTGSRLLAGWAFIPLLLLVAVLMASRIGFPEFTHMIRHRRESLGVLGGACLLSLFLPPAVVWFGGTSVYISFGLARAVVRSL